MGKEILHVVPLPSSYEFTEGTCPEDLQENIRENIGMIHDDEEAYELDITKDGVTITGAPAGIFYAHVTLQQLKLQYPDAIPCMHIEDRPRFKYRGFMLDCSRHFLPESDVMTLIDAASYYKINKFHWHLTDDQGWRIEIEKYPRLTEIGAQTGEEGRRSRFYTKKQIRRIIGFAKERNVEIIPEIEMPGHSTAAIASYPELGCTGESIPVETGTGVFANLICAGRDECLAFCKDVLDEVMDIFPSETIHIGGEEARKDHWKNCPYCQARRKALDFPDEDALQRWFTDQILCYLNSRGRSGRVWSDAFTGNDLTAERYSAQFWVSQVGNLKYQAALGHELVNSDTAAYYFDYPYRDEFGLGNYGHPINVDTILNYEPVPAWLTEKFAKQMIGTECALWTEHVPDLETAVQRLFPRLPAMAETAWTVKDARDNASFDERYIGTAAEFEKRRLRGQAPQELWH